ncbi:MAG: hypothetical protein ACXIUL_05615, partial [Wenzhouxiangella sp.]
MNLVGNPVSGQFTSLPSNTAGTGISVASNFGFLLEGRTGGLSALGAPGSGRFQFADLQLDFNTPVSNAVLHFSALGGIAGGKNFTLEFDFLQAQSIGATGISRLSGNTAFVVSGNQINSNVANPNANCNAAGEAACGSVHILGDAVERVYLRVFMRSNQTTAWPATGSDGIVISVSGEVSDQVPVFSDLPAGIKPGVTYTGLTLSCVNQGPNTARSPFCQPSALKGIVSNVSCSSASSLAPGAAITCTFDYTVPLSEASQIPDFNEQIPLVGQTGAINDRNGGPVGTAGNNQIITNVPVLLDFGDAPNSYGTFRAACPNGLEEQCNGPRHAVGGPWLPDLEISVGQLTLNDNDTTAEPDGRPDPQASADEANDGVKLADFRELTVGGGVECDGLRFDNTSTEFFYCAAVRVANPTDDIARLVGWVDFSGAGTFGNDCGTDGQISAFCDRSAVTLRIGDSGLADFDGTCSASGLSNGDSLGGPTWADGNIPANCEGVVVMVWQYGPTDTITAGDTFARFRISTDTRDDFGTDPSPLGFLDDGEVEDWFMEAGTVPVSIHAFESRFVRGGLEVSWSTASETHNQGFYLWGERGDGQFELLLPEMIVSEASGAVE